MFIGKCSLGFFGLVTNERPKFIKYDDGTFGTAYVGRTIWPWYRVGRRWSSRNPDVVIEL